MIPDGTHPDVHAAVLSAGAALEAAGWTREDAAPPVLGAPFEAWLAVMGHDVVASLPILRQVCGEQAFAIETVRGPRRPIDPRRRAEPVS